MQRNQLSMAFGLLLIGATSISTLGCSSTERGSQLVIEIPTSLGAPETARQFKSHGGWTLQASESPKAQSGNPVRFAAVNISGPDIKGKLYQVWESESGSTNPVISFPNVPKGSNRLVQVIAAAEGSEGMLIYYGDAVIQVDRDVVDAPPVQLQHLENATQGEADIAGRYLRADGTGPTGTLNVMFRPPNSKPPMILFRLDMVAGWFESMLATSNSFGYVLEETGETPWDAVSKDSEHFFAPLQPGRSVKIEIPAAYRPNWDNQSGPREAMAKRTIIAGFFGAPEATSNKNTCYTKSAVGIDLQDVYTGDQPSTTQVKWKDSPNLTTEAGVTRGGLDISGAFCSNPTRVDYLDRLVIDHQQIRNRDHILGFSGPFRRPNVNDEKLFDYSWASEQLTINWKYLPGVVSQSAIGGVDIFRRNRNSNDDRDLYGGPGGVQCGKLSYLGFSRLGNVAIPTETYVVNGVSSADYSNKNIQIVLCPYRDSSIGRRYLNSGAVVRMDSGGGGGGGGGQAPATQLVALSLTDQVTTAAAKAQSPIHASYPGCYPIRIEARDANGYRGSVSPGTDLIVSSSNGNDYFTNDSSCSSGLATSHTVNGFWGEQLVFMKSARSVAGSEAVLIRTETGSVTQLSTSFHVDFFSQASPADRLITKAPVNILAYNCYPISFLSRFGGSTPATITESANVTYVSMAGLQFYSDSYCNSFDTGTFSFSEKQLAAQKSFIYSGTLASINLQPTSAVPVGTLSALTLPVASSTVTQPGAISRVELLMSNQIAAETCQYVVLRALDSSNNSSPVTSSTSGGANLNFSLNANGGTFYGDSACSGGSITTTSIALGLTSKILGYKATVGGTVTPTASTTNRSAGVLTTEARSITVTAAVANHVMMIFPGQMISSGTLAGDPWPIAKGVPMTVDLRAVTPDGNLDSGFNLNSFGFNFLASGMPLTIDAEPSWSGGQASMVFRWNSGFPSNVSTGGQNSLQSFSSSPYFHEPQQLTIISTSGFGMGACQPLLVYTRSFAWNFAAPLMGPLSISGFTDTADQLDDVAYDNPACTGGAAPSIASNHSATVIYVNVSASGSVPNVSSIANNYSFGLSNGSSFTSAVSASVPTSASDWRILGHNSVKRGVCQPFMLMVADTNGSGVGATNPTVANVTTSDTNGRFFTDGTCAGAGTPSAPLSFAASDKAKVFYYRALGDATLTSTTSSGDTYTTGTLPVVTF